MKYKTIVVDPPWKYGAWGVGSSRSAFNESFNITPEPLPYSSMTVDEIKKLPIGTLADANCELYLWVTQKYLPIAFDVIGAWGFKYCQTLIWCKKPMGKGQGGVYCPTNEFLILGRKGRMPKVERVDSTWFEVKRTGKHSKKPEFFQDMIEAVSEEPRLEMFARRERVGWDVFGNEVKGSIHIEQLGENK
jgi:N6-adenosine-specific RNA methylase IME4